MRKYREVLCPVCEKKYMTYVHSDEGYDVTIQQADKKLNGWSDMCPKCNTFFLLRIMSLKEEKWMISMKRMFIRSLFYDR